MFRLEYLPAARHDMVEIARYISQELHNPSAAERLVMKMIASAENLTGFPYISPIHRTVKPLGYEYRKLLVDNYILFYWIDERTKTVTVARVIYARRDYEKLL